MDSFRGDLGVLSMVWRYAGPDATDGAAAAAIYVDIDRSLQDQLADPELRDALRHAEPDWWNQRRRLRSYLSATADGLAAAADAYQQVEQGLASAADPDRAAGDVRAA